MDGRAHAGQAADLGPRHPSNLLVWLLCCRHGENLPGVIIMLLPARVGSGETSHPEIDNYLMLRDDRQGTADDASNVKGNIHNPSRYMDATNSVRGPQFRMARAGAASDTSTAMGAQQHLASRSACR